LTRAAQHRPQGVKPAGELGGLATARPHEGGGGTTHHSSTHQGGSFFFRAAVGGGFRSPRFSARLRRRSPEEPPCPTRFATGRSIAGSGGQLVASTNSTPTYAAPGWATSGPARGVRMQGSLARLSVRCAGRRPRRGGTVLGPRLGPMETRSSCLDAFLRSQNRFSRLAKALARAEIYMSTLPRRCSAVHVFERPQRRPSCRAS